MKKLFFATILTSSLLTFNAHASAPDLSVYYMTTCPHCHHAREFIFDTLVIEYPFVNFNQKNVSEPANRGEFEKQLKKCKLDSYGVPLVVIGDKCFQGFGKGFSEQEYRNALNENLTAEEQEIVKSATAALAANPKQVRKENAEKISRAKAEKIVVEKPSGNGLLYGLLGVLAAALAGILFFPRKKK